MGFQVAIDGPAASGKSTIAKIIAKKFNFCYLDTGAMYRAVTLKALRLKIDLNSENEYRFLETTTINFENGKLILDGEDVSEEIRSLDVTNNVSLVSMFKYVRDCMVKMQQEIAASKNIIMDGRDIGTIVLPNANLKIFLTASAEVRARRRLNERVGTNVEALSFEETVEEIKARDYKDSHRTINPLCQADDAILIDSSELSVEDVINEITSLVSERGYRMENLEQKVVEVEETKQDEVVEEQQAEVAEEVAVEEEAANYKEMQLVRGTIVEVQSAKEAKGNQKARKERVLIELADGQEGFLFKEDASGVAADEELLDVYVEGDEIDVVIKKIFPDGGKFIFSTVLVEKRKEIMKFEEAIKENQTLSAKVVKVVPNFGLLLKHDTFACLLPTSLANVAEDQLETLVGTDIDVVPIRIDVSRIRLIVSQKKAAALKSKAEKNAFLETIQVGQVYEGTVKNVETYGAFVELGQGVEGLLHISEIDHNRISKVEKVLKVGDTVKVQVIKVDSEHIGLSRKALLPNKWAEYFQDKEVGSVVSGKVSKIVEKGVNVDLAEEVVAFIPRREFAWEKDTFVEDFVEVGDEIEAKIIEVDNSKRRVILSKRQLIENPWVEPKVKVGDLVEVTVVKAIKAGYKVSLDNMMGFLHKASVSGDPEALVPGSVVKVKVKILDPEKTKLNVGMKDAEEKVEKENYGKYMKSQEKVASTLGDFFKK